MRQKTIPGNSRLTAYVNAEDSRLANAPAVSTTVTSDLPVISERAMYWPGAFTRWLEAHNSFGVTTVATKWVLAEGRVGGAQAFDGVGIAVERALCHASGGVVFAAGTNATATRIP